MRCRHVTYRRNDGFAAAAIDAAIDAFADAAAAMPLRHVAA